MISFKISRYIPRKFNIFPYIILASFISFTHIAVADAKASKRQNQVSSIALADIESHIPLGSEVVNVEEFYRGNRPFTYVKYRNPINNTIGLIVLNPAGKPINQNAIPAFKRNAFGEELANLFDDPNSLLNKQPNSKHKVIVTLENEYSPADEASPLDIYSESDDSVVRTFINGVLVSDQEIDRITDNRSERSLRHWQKNSESMVIKRRAFLQRQNILESDIDDSAYDPGTFSIELTKQQLNKILKDVRSNKEEVALELFKPFKNEIDEDMQWTNIWTDAGFGVHKGTGIGIWQVEPDCAADQIVSNYDTDPVGFQGTSPPLHPGIPEYQIHAEYMARIMRNVTKSAHIVCTGGIGVPTLNLANLQTPKTQIVNVSAGQITSNTGYTTTDRLFDNAVYLTDLSYSVSSGNEGHDDVIVSPPARATNVITVGNVDESANPDVVFWSSSYKNSTLKNNKPEVVAPGANTDIAEIDSNYEQGGTSQSAAHTSGFIANLMSSNSVLKRRPHLTKALIMSGATKPVMGGQNKVGVGGIDYRNTSQHYKLYNFQGNSNAWDIYDQFDNGGADGRVERTYWLGANKPNARVAMAWSSSGSYVYNNDKIGADYDFEIFGPNGAYIGGGYNTFSPYEFEDFTVSVSGNYRVVITRISNNHPGGRLRLGLAINYDD